jgi:polyhydroxybutyrate depolymerase
VRYDLVGGKGEGGQNVMRHFLVAALALLLAVAGAFAYYVWTPLPELPQLNGTAITVTLPLEGHPRRFIEYVPSNLVSGSPLVIVLHGAAMNGTLMRRTTGYEFDRLADGRGFVLLYPDAFAGNWNDCRIASTTAARRAHIDDVGFIRAMIDQEKAKRGIDPAKVFVVGFSNGGHVALDLAALPQSPVAGIAVFASSLSTPEDSSCPQTTPTPPAMLVNGTADPIHPFGGGEISIFGLVHRGMVIGAEATARAFAERNGIASPPTTVTLPHHAPDDPTSVIQISWKRDDKPYVVLYEVRGGGHVVPQPAFRFPRIFGATTGDLDGPSSAIAFFLR